MNSVLKSQSQQTLAVIDTVRTGSWVLTLRSVHRMESYITVKREVNMQTRSQRDPHRFIIE